jgi:hypothetical protein
MQAGAVVLVRAFDVNPVTDLDLVDFTSFDVADKFSEGNFPVGGVLGSSDDLPKQYQHTSQYDPEDARLDI